MGEWALDMCGSVPKISDGLSTSEIRASFARGVRARVRGKRCQTRRPGPVHLTAGSPSVILGQPCRHEPLLPASAGSSAASFCSRWGRLWVSAAVESAITREGLAGHSPASLSRRSATRGGRFGA